MNARTRTSRTVSLLGFTLFACLNGGCVHTETSHRLKEPAPATTSAVHQVHATWEGRIVKTVDVTRNGAPLLGVAGRLYLFGEEVGYPVIGDGSVVVELSDVGKLDPQGKPLLIERWEIDAVTLKRLTRKDMIGWGYTLFLPWNTYRPDLTKVQMQVRYVPTKGLPLFSPPSVVSFRDDTRLTVTQRQVLPSQNGIVGGIAPPPMVPPPVVR